MPMRSAKIGTVLFRTDVSPEGTTTSPHVIKRNGMAIFTTATTHMRPNVCQEMARDWRRAAAMIPMPAEAASRRRATSESGVNCSSPMRMKRYDEPQIALSSTKAIHTRASRGVVGMRSMRSI